MKKIISILITSLFFIIFTPIVSEAAPKENTKCTSVGKLSGKLTCISLDGKKFWYELTLAKGVKKYAKANTDCYRENMITKGYNKDNKLIDLICKYPTIAKGTEYPKWTLRNPIINSTVEISIDNLDRIGVSKKAYENVISIIKSRPKSNYSPNILVGPNVNKSRVDQEIEGINRAIDLWSPYFQPDKFQVIYVVEGDEEWLENKSIELGLGSMVPPGETWTNRFKMFRPCGFAMAGKGNSIPTFVQCLNAEHAGGFKQTGPHEYTHLFQLAYGGSNNYTIPWYTEGSASYFGWTIGFYPNDKELIDRKSWLRSLYLNMSKEAQLDFSSRNIESFKKRMKMLVPSPSQEVATVSYWAGALATEVLIALYGFDKFVEFSKNIQTNNNMSSLLMQTYGFNEEYFYDKLAPYVWANL
jgi:hypothetical protein